MQQEHWYQESDKINKTFKISYNVKIIFFSYIFYMENIYGYSDGLWKHKYER